MEIFGINDFKVGDKVWLSGISFFPSGRIKSSVSPVEVKVRTVSRGSLTLDLSSIYSYRVPVEYYDRGVLDLESGNYADYQVETDLNLHLSRTKEDAIKKFNRLITWEIEKRYKGFRDFEEKARRRYIN